MTKFNLKDAIIGNLFVKGASLSDVLNNWGKPDDEGVMGLFIIYRFGNIEVTFLDKEIYFIQLNNELLNSYVYTYLNLDYITKILDQLNLKYNIKLIKKLPQLYLHQGENNLFVFNPNNEMLISATFAQRPLLMNDPL